MDLLNIKLDVQRSIYSLLSKALTPRTQTITAASFAAGTTVAAGAKQVIIVTDGTYAGNINGVAGVASTTYRFDASGMNVLPAIPITRSAGNFIVTTVV